VRELGVARAGEDGGIEGRETLDGLRESNDLGGADEAGEASGMAGEGSVVDSEETLDPGSTNKSVQNKMQSANT